MRRTQTDHDGTTWRAGSRRFAGMLGKHSTLLGFVFPVTRLRFPAPPLNEPCNLNRLRGFSLNDAEILLGRAVLTMLGPESEWPRIEEATERLRRVWSEFDYLQSSEVAEKVAGKSAAAETMIKKFANDPVRSREMRSRLERALGLGADSAELRLLLAAPAHESAVLAFSLLRCG